MEKKNLEYFYKCDKTIVSWNLTLLGGLIILGLSLLLVETHFWYIEEPDKLIHSFKVNY